MVPASLLVVVALAVGSSGASSVEIAVAGAALVLFVLALREAPAHPSDLADAHCA